MKNFLAILLSSVLLYGCLAPSEKAADALKKVSIAEKKVQSAEIDQTKFAATSAHAVAKALDAAKPGDRAVEVAKTFNDRTQLALPQPDAKAALSVESLVKSLLEERKGSEAQLAAYDQKLAGLQAKIDALEAAKTKVETKRDDTLTDLSALADLGARFRFWLWAAGILIGLVVFGPPLLRLVGMFIPAVGPIAGISSFILGRIGSAALSAVPGAASSAGYVAQQAHDRIQHAFEDVLTGVQRARKQDQAVAAVLDPILEKATGPRDSQLVIRDTKTKLRL